MNHLHFCDFGAGHLYECPGSAVRLFEKEPTVCMCEDHGTPLDEGNHRACSVERLSCPEHRREQLKALGYEVDNLPDPGSREGISNLFTDAHGNSVVGWCAWCLADFHCVCEAHAHRADHMAACPAFDELRNNRAMIELLNALDQDEDEIEF